MRIVSFVLTSTHFCIQKYTFFYQNNALLRVAAIVCSKNNFHLTTTQLFKYHYIVNLP